MALLYGRAGRLHTKNAGFRPRAVELHARLWSPAEQALRHYDSLGKQGAGKQAWKMDGVSGGSGRVRH
jgi:hypothetical protein